MGLPLTYPSKADSYENSGGLSSAAIEDDYSNMINFTFYSRQGTDGSDLYENVFLYMPNNIESPLSASWEGASVGAEAAGFSKVNAIISGQARNAENIYNNLWTMGQGTDVQGEDATSAINKEIQNPYLKMLFRGIGFRNFELTFKFTPRNESEVDTISKIVKLFRECSMPDLIDDGTRLGYPSEVAIEYVRRNEYGQYETNPHLPKFKPCVLNDVHVNYSSAGHFAAMRDGSPLETELRLQFTENALVYKSDIKKGF